MSFDISMQSDYILVKLKGEISGDEKPTLHQLLVEEYNKSGFKYIIFQCNECSNMSSSFLRQMSQIYRDIKTTNGQLRLVSARPEILDVVKKNGLDRILINKMSLRGALVDFGLAKTKDFDVNFINPFLKATQKVFKIQCFMECRPQKVYIKKATDPLLLGDVSGIISISSETFSGTLAISLAETIFLKVVGNMLGEEHKAITDQNVDVVGELANIILGQAKLDLAALGYGIQTAIPSCVWGKDHKIKHFAGGVCMVIPFETDVGTFYSEIMTNTSIVNPKATEDKKTISAA